MTTLLTRRSPSFCGGPEGRPIGSLSPSFMDASSSGGAAGSRSGDRGGVGRGAAAEGFLSEAGCDLVERAVEAALPRLLVVGEQHGGRRAALEFARRHPDEPHRPEPGVRPALEHAHRRGAEVLRRVHRLGQGFVPRDRLELPVADLHRDAPRAEPVATEAPRDLVRLSEEHAAHLLAVLEVLLERALLPDALRLAVGDDGALVHRSGEPPEVRAGLAEAAAEPLLAPGAEVADGLHARPGEGGGGLRTYAPQPADLHREEDAVH